MQPGGRSDWRQASGGAGAIPRKGATSHAFAAIPWMDSAYLLDVTEEEKVVMVRTFAKA